VLDVAAVPEKKSFPPRTIIVLFGTCLAIALGSVWVLADATWKDLEADDPGKQLGEEILHTARMRVRDTIKKFRSRKFGFGS
jgi:hypothetical protein